MVKKELPDIEKVSFDKRTECSFVFQNADGGDIYVQTQILFTDVGYNIVVIGDNEDDYKTLSKWSESIEPVKKSAKKEK